MEKLGNEEILKTTGCRFSGYRTKKMIHKGLRFRIIWIIVVIVGFRFTLVLG